mmetsp:Transcript_141912/g.353690  ORF Transcript_141912/g.353690 Transcript_141912/m.353690 type:complete len:223 (-) Transcript_141912:199-867(-)
MATERPGIPGEVVEKRVQGELTLRDRHQEAAGGLSVRASTPPSAKAELVSHLLSRVLLRPPKGIRLGQCRRSELVDVHHSAEGDKAYERVLRHHREGLLQGVLRLLELLFDNGGVENEEEDRGVAHRLRDDVLDGGAHRQQLSRQVVLVDVLCIVRGERIPICAKRTCPTLRMEVHKTARVQHGSAVSRPADHRLVLHQLQAVRGFQRGVQATQRHDDPGCV